MEVVSTSIDNFFLRRNCGSTFRFKTWSLDPSDMIGEIERYLWALLWRFLPKYFVMFKCLFFNVMLKPRNVCQAILFSVWRERAPDKLSALDPIPFCKIMWEIKVEMVILSFHILQEEVVVSILLNNEISVTDNEISSNSAGRPACREGRFQCGNLTSAQ